MTPPLAWNASSQRSACCICVHGKTGTCTHAAVKAPLEAARLPHGACGPEARYLDFPGLNMPERKR